MDIDGVTFSPNEGKVVPDNPKKDGSRDRLNYADGTKLKVENEEESEEVEKGESIEGYELTEGEIQLIVEDIKNITTLFDLNSSDWSDEVTETIRNFVVDKKIFLLTIYFDGDNLMASYTIPSVQFTDIFYFARLNHNMELTKQNFEYIIIFGNLCDKPEESMIKILENVYAPIVYNTEMWPQNVKEEVSYEVTNFLISLAQFKFSMSALTGFHVPYQDLNILPEKLCRDGQLVRRLEHVVLRWYTHIRTALNELEHVSPVDAPHPIEHFGYWRYRFENLCFIWYLMQDKYMIHVCNILLSAQSPYIKQFFLMIKDVQNFRDIAKQNCEYLQLLINPCFKMNNIASPAEIPYHIPKILFLIKFIWAKSPYLNTNDFLLELCCFLSNQVVSLCVGSIKLKFIFDNEPKKAITMLETVIFACTKYKELYSRAVSLHNTFHNKPWTLPVDNIFSRVDILLQRCKDMVEVCNTMIIFGRVDETTTILKPSFGWTRGAEYEKIVDKVEQKYWACFRYIRTVQDSMLELHSNDWPSNMLKFHEGLHEVEVIIENLLASAFGITNNVEEGIEVLQSMYQYSKRSYLYPAFESKTTQLYKMFLKEIQESKKELLIQNRKVVKGMPRYAGRAMIANQIKQRLWTLNNMLEDAKFLVDCKIVGKVMEQYDILVNLLDDIISGYYSRWNYFLSYEVHHRMKRSLIARSPKKTGLLQINFDRKLMIMAHEGRYWTQIGLAVPPHVSKLLGDFDSIINLYRGVESVVMDYNRIVSSLSDSERMLFGEHIKKVDRAMLPGIEKIHWNSELAEKFVVDSTFTLSKLQDFVLEYKKCNLEITNLCEMMCCQSLIEIPFGEVFSLEQLKENLHLTRMKRTNKLVDYFIEIYQFTVIIYEGFEEYIDKAMGHWKKYIEKIDDLILESLRHCVKTSLKQLLGTLKGSDKLGPSFQLNLISTLKNTQIIFKPALIEICTVIQNILPEIIFCLQKIPRLFEKYEMVLPQKKVPYAAIIACDRECNFLQDELECEMKNVVGMVYSYLRRWRPFKDIWEVNKNKFIDRYEIGNPNVESFVTDIKRYFQQAECINEQPNKTLLSFLYIDTLGLKERILKHCDQWCSKLTLLLMKMTARRIEKVYKYCNENGIRSSIAPKLIRHLPIAMKLCKMLNDEIRGKELELSAIKEQILVLISYRDDVPQIMLDRAEGLEEAWKAYLKCLEKYDDILHLCQESFLSNVTDAAKVFEKDASNIFKKFWENGPFTPDWSTKAALAIIRDFKKEYNVILSREKKLKRDLAVFDITHIPSSDLAQFEKDWSALKNIWDLTYSWDKTWENYKTGLFWAIKTEDMEMTAQDLYKKLTNLVREFRDRNWTIIEHTRKRVDAFRRVLPLINDLKNKCMRERHWDHVRKAVGVDFDEKAPTFTLELIMDVKMQDHADEINDISNAATMELNIENAITNINNIWGQVVLDIIPHKDKGIYRLKGTDEIFQQLEEHLTSISAMKGSRFVQPFLELVEYWEKHLSVILEVLEAVLGVQRQFLYLEASMNIFTGEDIRKQLPKESDDFDKVTATWKKITTFMFEEKYAFQATHFPGQLTQLLKLIDQLENIQRALEKYLETKRHIFPRFYFISNDDLLEILGNSKRPDLIQPHFKKLFDNINRIKMQKHPLYPRMEGMGMFSGDGEYIEWISTIQLEGPVEGWLCSIEDIMRRALKEHIKEVRTALSKLLNKRDKWIKEWPGQLCITSSQIQWTTDCTRTLLICKSMGRKAPLKKMKKKQNQVLSKFSDAVRSDLTKIQRLKVVAIVTIEIHARDVIEKMYKANCLDVSAFEWLSQLRFYWDQDVDDCIVRQTNTHFLYGYEYLGNSGRLVITPLTDRCYITLTTALHLHRGGSPKGPAGTGKTETVKDLGKALAYYVIVINCSEGLDYKSMGRMFSGLAQTGAWGCFDEFNRINIEVLSVVAQQILSIISALSAKAKTFTFEGTVIKLVHTCGVFITMNPGYAGRTELPDNLKSMFRPISMMVPDSMLIAEITLFGEGFRDTRVLAKKVFTLFSLAKQQLSKQDHYDFGLRGMVALLRYAGKKRRQHSNMPDEEVVLLAMKDMNIAKLTSDDLPLFNGITHDLFPGIELPTIDYEVLYTTIKGEMKKCSLQAVPISLTKVIQLYETKGSRHSVMIVGASGAAKSTTWKVLKASMTSLKKKGVSGYEVVQEYPINPKALNLGELYGEFNLATNEWLDGVLSAIMRKTCSDEGSDEKWILFDGPVDAVWIENMNSVMDDNKVLTLINSERITMPEQVSLLFEVEDLVVASPATVSRCGMVFNDYKDFGWRPYVDSWLQSQTNKNYKRFMRSHFDTYLDITLDFKRLNCVEIVPVPELCAVKSLCKLLQCLARPENCFGQDRNDIDTFGYMTKLWFLFCMIWSVGACVNEAGRGKIDVFIRELEGVFPLNYTVYEYHVNQAMQCMSSWEDKLPENWKYNPEASKAQAPKDYKVHIPLSCLLAVLMKLESYTVLNKLMSEGLQDIQSQKDNKLHIPISSKLEMASKRRNMFYQNKKQETTEIGMCNLPSFCSYTAIHLQTLTPNDGIQAQKHVRIEGLAGNDGKRLPFFKIIVPTVDTVRYDYFTSTLLKNNTPVLLIGVVGTGKSSTAISVLDNLDSSKYSLLTVNMSAQTTSNNVQDTIESRVEKRTKGVYYPIGGKMMITFMDDLNMPAKEIYGAQPPLELIRQWIDYGFWYNRTNQTTTSVRDMLLLAAMGPPGGGRNTISNRLLSRFSVINMTFPDEVQIQRIFMSMLSQHTKNFDGSVSGMCEGIVKMTISLYKTVIEKMLPTPAKMHYLFNLRDISKVFQGLLRSNTDNQNKKPNFLRLWIHEAFRVFNDRLIDEEDQSWFQNQVNNELGAFFELTFHNLCPNKQCPIFCEFMNQYNLYEEAVDLQLLRNFIEKQMDDYNASPGVIKLDLVLFTDAIQHICRIARVISQPRGHVLLVGIGGGGRQSLSRVAAWLCTYNTFQIQLTRNYHINEFKEDLKSLYYATGVKDAPTSFLFCDNQVAEETFLEIINNVLSTGEVSNLYKAEEFEDIKNVLFDVVKKHGIIPTAESVYAFLIDRVRGNLHIIICMSPVGDAFRVRLRQYPSLINCTTIDWFLEWPKEALLEVAQKYLQTVDMLETITGVPLVDEGLQEYTIAERQEMLRQIVASIFSIIHDSVNKYSKRMLNELKRHNYVTPTNYLELVAGYKFNLANKRSEIAKSANKLRNGLSKIDETRIKVAEMTVELEAATVKVNQMNKECDEFLVLLMYQRREADETQQNVAAKSVRIAEEEVNCQALADVALADLQLAMPALEEAIQALDALNKKDLTEIKSYGRPPAKVEMVMEAVMILKQVTPSWAEAKKQLGEVNFLNQLRDFDKDHISDRTLRKVHTYTSLDDFDPEKVGVVSTAAKSLAMWVIAIEKYGNIYKVVAPKKAKLDEAMQSLKEKQASLAEAKGKLAQLQKLLEKLQKDYDDKLNEKEELRKRAEMLQLKLDRASDLIDGLAGERVRWGETIRNLDGVFDLLPGDCLLATAFVSYMGPFVSSYREELMLMWKTSVSEMELPCSLELKLGNFLATPTLIREWNILGLPSDAFSTENGIITNQATRWPLIIDPQAQAWKWIRNMEGPKGLKTVDFGVPDYMRIIEIAMQRGEPILLQNVSEVLDPSVIPILNKALVKKGNETYIKVGDKLVDYNEKFKFFITTKMSNPHFPPEILTKTTLVNFAIKEEGLQAQLLGIVVRKEKPKLEELKDNLVLNIAAGRRTLMELEDELLRLLNESEGSLLDNMELITTLKSSKETSVAVNEQLESSLITEVEIDHAREGYVPCAVRASILFFVLYDLSFIDPMYQFSLDSYIDIFENSIKKSKRSDNLSERITSLNDYHTYAVYRNTCRGLFERHKLLFSFYVGIKILDAQGKIRHSDYQFLLKGGVVLDKKEQPQNPCIDWLPPESWDNITEMDKLSGFHGVVKTFEQFPKEWGEWYFKDAPESCMLIGEWQDICSEFQRMLFIRSLRPDRLSFCITSFVTNNIGSHFTEPPVLDIKAVFEDSSYKTPLIFVLSPGVDPTSALIQLAENSGMSSRFQSLSLGQGQAPFATRMIEQGSTQGNWVFLANCHLSLSWMPGLDKIIENLQSSGNVHKDFRLWLSSSPHPDFPISILQTSIKMTTEPPKGIRANMKRLYNMISDTQFSICKCKHKYKKLLYSLCFFHAILIERKKFQQLGWNVVYSFNDSDFEVSENLLSIYLDEYRDTPWDALKYLIAGICYGGHVTDDWDRRLLTTYINRYFNDDAITVPFYRLSALPTYFIPTDTEIENYREFINTLPAIDHPNAFGQHPNADTTSLMIDTRILCETLMSLQVTSSDASGESKEVKVMALADDVLNKVPEPINYELTERHIGPRKTPLDVVLLQEISRYNVLLIKMEKSLVDLKKGIQGFIVMSSELEEIFTCIYDGRVPSMWLKAYPSLKTLGSWTYDLVLRVQHFSKWATKLKPPLLFWLSAFTFPTGFLTAVLQTSSRRLRVPIDLLGWEFTPQTREEREFQASSNDGVFIRGLYLEGAGWDKKGLSLCEPGPLKLVCSMPVILFRPVESLKRRTRGYYSCPVYYYPQRCGTQGREAFVLAVDLKSGSEPADHWIKRGTAILLSLSN